MKTEKLGGIRRKADHDGADEDRASESQCHDLNPRAWTNRALPVPEETRETGSGTHKKAFIGH